MPDHNADDDKPLTPEQQKIVSKARWLMMMSGFATFLGIAVVIGVVGYRMFRSDGSAAPREVTALLPKGAKVVQTAVSEDRIVITVELGGTVEIRAFDIRTMQPVGRLRFATEP